MERLCGVHPVLEALRARRRALHRVRVRRGLRPSQAAALAAAAREAGVPVEEIGAEEFAAAAGELPAQGVLLDAGPLPETPIEALARMGGSPRMLVALDGVEDPQNLGAIARVAEAAGVGGLILTRRRAAPLGPAAARASAGAVEWLASSRVPNLVRALNQLKSLGFWIFGCETGAPEDLFRLPDRVLRGDRVVVLGAEGRGLRPGVRKVLDHRIRIPMSGRVESLNVSTAAAVLLFELGRRDQLARSA